MTDEIIKEETAKLAKEKGYNIGCTRLWGVYGGYEGLHVADNYNKFNGENQYSAPTQTTLANWIRTVYKIHVEIYCNASGFGFILSKLNGTTIKEIENDIFFETNEDALEVGLVFALNEKKIV